MATQINTDYKTGLKREVVEAMRPIFGNNFPIAAFRNKVYVGLEYPYDKVQYPAIYIKYQEQELRNIGIGHYEQARNDDGTPYTVAHWFFQGSVSFNVMALNPVDREQITSSLINILAFGKYIPEFQTGFNDLLDMEFVDLQLNTDILIPSGEQTGSTPWDSEDERVYGNGYSVPAIGEFYSNPYTGELVEISRVIVDPYIPGQAPPW